jgi:hypothetical protein
MTSLRATICPLLIATLLIGSMTCSSKPESGGDVQVRPSPAQEGATPTSEPSVTPPEPSVTPPEPSVTPAPAGTLPASQILMDAIPATEAVSSSRIHAETTLSTADDEVLVVVDIESTREIGHYKQTISGATSEAVIRRSGETCIRFEGEEWMVQDAPATDEQTTSESNFNILREVIGPAFLEPVRHDDETLEDGREVYVITSSLDRQSGDEPPEGLLSVFDSVTDIDAFRIRVMIEKDTSYLAVMRWDMEGEGEDGEFILTSEWTYDRYNEPIRLPEDLPDACAT